MILRRGYYTIYMKKITKKSESQKRSEASKKGWVTRRLNAKTSGKVRKITSEKLKKLQKEEKTRNTARRKAQMKGRSIATDKPKLSSKKPTRLARRTAKKRVAVR